jgi:hypothetical protein
VAPPMAEEAAAPAPAVTAEPEVLTERRPKEEAGAEDEGKRERTKK